MKESWNFIIKVAGGEKRIKEERLFIGEKVKNKLAHQFINFILVNNKWY